MIVKIGTYTEKESREITQHTSYAADYIIHKTKPRKYDAYLEFSGGFTIPMPHWVLITLDTNIIDGKLYSGFGGVNFASEDVKKESSKYTIQSYSYYIPEMVKDGNLELNDTFKWLNGDTSSDIKYIKDNNITWEYLSQFVKK